MWDVDVIVFTQLRYLGAMLHSFRSKKFTGINLRKCQKSKCKVTQFASEIQGRF